MAIYAMDGPSCAPACQPLYAAFGDFASACCASSRRSVGAVRAAATWRSGAATCNAVDGFDAAFTGWGREDSDIFVRLIRAGVRRKDGRFASSVLHLWHPEADRTGIEANERQLDEVLASARITARRGLSMLRKISPRPPRGDDGPREAPVPIEASPGEIVP